MIQIDPCEWKLPLNVYPIKQTSEIPKTFLNKYFVKERIVIVFKKIHDKNLCYIIRNENYYLVKSLAQKEIYKCTILECNLNNEVIEIIDVLCHAGELTHTFDYKQRLILISSIKNNICIDCFEIDIIKNTSYDCDDEALVIYITSNGNVLCGNGKGNVKTCVFYLKSNKLCLLEKGEYKATKQLLINEPNETNCAIECIQVGDKWKMIKLNVKDKVFSKYLYKKIFG